MNIFDHLLSTEAYWEGQWFDLWSIPHTLFGILMAFASALAGLSDSAGYAITATLALAWEIFERVTGISITETPLNSLADIVFALVGFGIGYLILRRVTGRRTRIIVLAALTFVWLAMDLVGGLAYSNYAPGRL